MPNAVRALAALCLVGAAPVLAQDRVFVLDTNPQTNAELIELDLATATPLATYPLTGHQALFGGLARDRAGDLFSIDGYNDANPDRTFRIDPTTGVGTVVGPTNFNWNFRAVAVNPVDDVLYGWTDNRLYRLDRTTGAATLVANVPGVANLDQGTAIAISETGQGYLTDIGGTSLFRFDLVTGAATFLGNLNITPQWFGDLDFDSQGRLLGVHETGGIYVIDVATATATLLHTTTVYSGLAIVRDGLGTTYCSPAAPNSRGLAGRIRASGSLVASANTFTVEASLLPFATFGFFLTSRTSGFTANPGGSAGNLCLAGAIGRFIGPGQVQNTQQTGRIALSPNLAALPTPTGPVAASVGVTWHFQAWHRDTSPSGVTSNFTDAVSVTWQ